MDFAYALISFYLLLPVLYPEQKNLLNLAKPNQNEKENFVTRQELVEFLSAKNDLDSLQKNIIPYGLENEFDENSEVKNESSSEQEIQKEESATQIILKSSSNKIRLFKFGEEQFCLDSNNQKKSLVSVNSELFTLSTYDEKSRLVEFVEWQNASTLDASIMLRKISYSYSEETDSETKIPKIILTARREENFKEKTLTLSEFDENSLLKRNDVYSVESDGKYFKTQSSAFDYDDEKRLLLWREINYYKEGDEAAKISKLSKKYSYRYKENFENPDIEYFENDILRLKTEYLSDSDYVETSYFDGGLEIKSYYENNVKVFSKIESSKSENSEEKNPS